MVGLIDDPAHITTQWFKEEGDIIVLLGEVIDDKDALLGLGGSAYLQGVHGLKTGTPPRLNLVTEKQLHDGVRALIAAGLVKSAHDCSDGGLAVALAECCISQQIARETPRLIGATIDLTALQSLRLDALLFGETQGRIIISVHPTNLAAAQGEALRLGVAFRELGTVGGDQLTIRSGGSNVSLRLTELHDIWWNAIARAMQ